MVDEDVFVRETRAILPMLYRVSMGILYADADAQDAMQQALTKAWEKRQGVEPDFFRAWLMRITINECRNVQRHRKRVMPVESVECGQWTDFPSLDIADAVNRLPEKLRIPFLLKYLAEYKEAEVAAILKIPKTTVKNRLRKARLELRGHLSDWEVTFK